MQRKDNQTDTAQQLQKPEAKPAQSSSGSDGMTVTNTTGERIQLGEKPQQTK